jgi:hypothetical protein
MLQQAETMSEMFKIMASFKGAVSGVTQLLQMMTSGKSEDLESLQEFVATNSKLNELGKKLFGEER